MEDKGASEEKSTEWVLADEADIPESGGLVIRFPGLGFRAARFRAVQNNERVDATVRVPVIEAPPLDDSYPFGDQYDFIEALTGTPHTPVTFQTFDDNKAARDPELAKIYHGTLEKHFEKLGRLNNKGAGVFVCVNETDLKGREAKNVTAIRAVFTDHDNGTPSVYALPPSFETISVQGNHAYWLLEPGTPLEAFEPAQRRLAAFYGSDPNVHDLSRVMRLPGFFHQKGDPVVVRFKAGTGQRYTLDEVLAAHPVITGRRIESTQPVTVEKIPDGQRTAFLTKHAGWLRRQGANYEVLHATLRLLNVLQCDPPVSDEKIEGIAFAYNKYPPEGQPKTVQWPTLDEIAYHGLPGEIVRTIDPHTEADPVAVLVHFLVMFGNAVGRVPYCVVGADQHFTNLFAVMVGETAKGRKGSALNAAKRLFQCAEPLWAAERMQSGLSTGEGVIHAVRDPVLRQERVKRKDGDEAFEEVLTDKGVEDKRLFISSTEFASTLKVASREGNILSDVLRQAWDFGDLRVMSKTSPSMATGAHISIIGHSTIVDLQKYLTDTETANGFGNRFLWVCARRSKLLPDGGAFDDLDLRSLGQRLGAALTEARRLDKVTRDQDATMLWREKYEELSHGGTGVHGALTSRAEAQVLRLSLVYALADREKKIGSSHLRAALSLWDYCDASVRYIFGDAIGDQTADRILEAARGAAEEGISRTDVNGLFAGNKTAKQLDRALALLSRLRRIVACEMTTGGRPETRYFAV